MVVVGFKYSLTEFYLLQPLPILFEIAEPGTCCSSEIKIITKVRVRKKLRICSFERDKKIKKFVKKNIKAD